MKKLCIIQRVACDYRKEFYLLLRDKLADKNVSLTLAAGLPWHNEGLVDILDSLDFGVRCKNRRVVGKAYWESGALKAASSADLIIFEQANSALVNYPLLIKRWLGGKAKVAFWGHGANMNEAGYRFLKDRWKKWMTNNVDWWFPYTDLSANIVVDNGFPEKKMTVVNNAIDTHSLQNARDRITNAELNVLHNELFPQDDSNKRSYPMGVYCGRLTQLKRIPFLLEAVELIHRRISSFRMVIVGDGPEKQVLGKFCANNEWCVHVGAIHNLDRIKYLGLGDVFLIPSAVGLAILDSFSLGIPMITTNIFTHGPEIAYLQHGSNGLRTECDPQKYADAVVDLLNNKADLEKMKAGAIASSKMYSVEAMSENYKNGILKCLAI